MDPFELKLKNALTRTDPIPAGELATLNDHIVRTFARRQKAFSRLTATYLVVMMIAMIVLLALFMYTTDLKQCLLFGIVILILFEGTVLMKLWFWVMHGKLATVREIKLLQVAVAELKTHSSPDPRGVAAAFPDEVSTPATAPRSTAPSTRKLWQAILIPAWLLAMASLVYLEWLQNPFEPQDVTPYFQKTGTAADGAAKTQWQQSFEVNQARQHFYVRLASRGQTALVWINVSAENREPMFAGPVAPGSRIFFGQAAPGRYVVNGRTERAEGDFTLRIGGVDGAPGRPSLGRLFLLILSGAVTVAIPLAWLQNRWLRRIDPELQRW